MILLCLNVWHVSVEFGNQCFKVIRTLHCIQVLYQVQLENGVAVMVMLYLVHAQPSIQDCQTDILPKQRSQADRRDGCQWHLVTRSGSRFNI